jgi:hypothetical protein
MPQQNVNMEANHQPNVAIQEENNMNIVHAPNYVGGKRRRTRRSRR